MQGTEHDIAFALALGSDMVLFCIALYYVKSFFFLKFDQRKKGWMTWQAPEDIVYKKRMLTSRVFRR